MKVCPLVRQKGGIPIALFDKPYFYFFFFGALIIAGVASCHALLHRRDPRAALWWTGMIWALPFIGALLYYLFGINRIIRRKMAAFSYQRLNSFKAFMPAHLFSRESDHSSISPRMRYLFSLAKVGDQVLRLPLLYGNDVKVFRNGDDAYPAMIKEIDQARESVSLSTYIFKLDEAGGMFVDALRRAKERGVEVRALMDDLGSGFFFSKVGRTLQQYGIPVTSFNPTMTVANLPYLNLRNHRKILVVDGRVGFCGGMNIHKENLVLTHPTQPVFDLQFRIEGPAAAQIQQAFVEDWYFSTKEELKGQKWFPKLYPMGTTFCRGIADGPDENLERLRWILLGAVNIAQQSITIMSPYFVPDQSLMNALGVASLRGVQVNLILPAENDWALVNWASMGSLRQVLERGCRVWMTPPPFDHSKLMIVDGGWCLLGSSNWDTRSLRLNFEFNMECYDETLAQNLMGRVRERMAKGKELTLRQINNRPLPVRLRDGMARLFAPHL